VLKSPLILSDCKTLKPIHIFEGLQGDAITAKFSPDGQFLAAADKDGKFMIWKLNDYSVVSSKVLEKKVTTFAWGTVESGKKFPAYTLFSTNTSQIEVHKLQYDIGTMVYFCKSEVFTLPNTGLTRIYVCNQYDSKGQYFYAGTNGGEICAFETGNKIFKASIQVFRF
jgi:WD40 repeat protein